MDNQPLQFRNAVFGGFNKQDVLNYMEKVTKEHTERADEFQKELAVAREEKAALAHDVEELKAQIEAVKAEKAALSEALAGREESLALSIQKSEDLKAQLAEVKAELEQIAPAAKAYSELKDRAAGIELDAHARAQAVEEKSREKAEKARMDTLAWLDRLQETYDSLAKDLEKAISGAAEELLRTEEQVRSMGSAVRAQEGELKAIREEVERAKPLAPKPFAVVEEKLTQPTPFTK